MSAVALKGLIQKHKAEAVVAQKIHKIEGTIVPEDDIDDPLALEQPNIVEFDWKNGQLELTFDKEITQGWIVALQNMGSFTAVHGVDPKAFSFRGRHASAFVDARSVQDVIDHFKKWLPKATEKLKSMLKQQAAQEQARKIESLKREREAEEKRLRILRDTKL